MNHLEEQDLILYYYGELEDRGAAAAHLDECEGCRASLKSLEAVLRAVNEAPVPERSAFYGAQVWRRIENQILPRRKSWTALLLPRLAIAGAMALLMVGAFMAGRFSPRTARQAPVTTASGAPVRERILLVAVGDHLERSQMVLVELQNADPRSTDDISAEQERAADLVSANRLFRQTAAGEGDEAIAGLLEDLERVLLEIVHAPSRPKAADLQRLRRQIESEGILFKIRVASPALEEPPQANRL